MTDKFTGDISLGNAPNSSNLRHKVRATTGFHCDGWGGHVAKNSINFGRVNFYVKTACRDDLGNEYGKSFTQIDTNEQCFP